MGVAVTSVLITGAAGFAGHHLTEHVLRTTDWNIVVVDKLTYASSGFDRLRDVKAFDNKRVRCFTSGLKIESELEREIGEVDYVVHLAAETHVDNSIRDPIPFVETNVLGTAHLLEWARRRTSLKRFLFFSTDEVFGPAPEGVEYKEWDRYNSGNPYAAAKAGGEELCLAWANTYKMPIIVTHCHDSETRAFTPNGIHAVRDMSVGDIVFALRGEELVETPIREIVIEPYKGPMVRVRTQKVSHLVTPNHRELISRPIGRPRRWQPLEIVHADSLEHIRGRIRIPVSGTWHCAEAVPIEVPQAKHFNANKLKPVSVDTMLSLLGWFVTEGSFGGPGTISIPNKNPDVQKHIVKLFAEFGLEAHIHGINVQASSIALASFLEINCGGRGAVNKRLPKWALSYQPIVLTNLLNTMMAGDGTWYNNGANGYYYTVSRRLAEQVCELAIKCGRSAGISKRWTWNPAKTVMAESLVVHVRQSTVSSVEPRRHVSMENYNGEVWCLRTDEGNFFVERDGLISCSGNTMNILGERQNAEKYVPLVVRKVLAGETVTIHANPELTKAGSRFYIHARNVAAAVCFLLTHEAVPMRDKFNIVGEREVDNLMLASMIADIIGKPLKYEMVNFHASRPGHDLRYGLDGSKLRAMGHSHPKNFIESLEKTIKWMIAPENARWLRP